MLEPHPDDIPRWPFAVMRIYGGLMCLGAAAARVPPGSTGEWLTVVLLSLLGLALVVGVTTRLAALLGAVVVASQLLPVHGITTAINAGPRTALVVLLLTVALGRGGRLFGVDATLAQRYPGSPWW